MDDPQHLALSRDHPLADAPEIRMEDLADEVWIEGRDSACAEPLRLAAGAAGFEPKICFESAQWLGKQGLVAAGVGITLIPTLALATVREDIVLRSLKDARGARSRSPRWAAATRRRRSSRCARCCAGSRRSTASPATPA
jgi:DNA-binding transcriptional LysR family regulator